MSNLHTTLVIAVSVTALIVFPLLDPKLWQWHGSEHERAGEADDDTAESPCFEPEQGAGFGPETFYCPDSAATSANPASAEDTGDSGEDEHWSSVQRMLASPEGSRPNHAEIRSLAAQYLAAYIRGDHRRMALILASVRADDLLAGMTWVAHTYALVSSTAQDISLEEALARDCASSIRRLSAEAGRP